MATELISGIHTLSHVLRHQPERVLEIWLGRKSDKRIDALMALAHELGIPSQTVRISRLDEYLKDINHQGIAAVCRPKRLLGEADLQSCLEKSAKPFFLVLDEIQDPHNLGACLRTADAAGVTAVIIPKARATGLTASVSKVACGATETVDLIQVSNLSRSLQMLKKEGVWLMGAEVPADNTLYSLDLNVPLALVLGAEHQGLRSLTRSQCDYLFELPMQGHVESLNVSVAAGICLFEVQRQRARQ